VQFVFPDKENKAVALHVRRGVVEYVPVPADYYQEPDYVAELDSETWAALYLSSIDLAQAAADGKVKLTKGNATELAELFDLFDKFVPTRNYKIPPLED
jgi:alkyl sulfatase BDS1-like metallo-beta-lactamase superfamily hydrolase